jgi:VanZ family protein
MIKLLKKNILSLITALIIMYMSLAPSNTFKDVDLDIPYLDKIVHFLMYFGLTIVLLFEHRTVLKNNKSILLLAIIPVAFGTIMEFLQALFTETRQGDFFDAVFNTIGVLLALILWKVFLIIKESVRK